MSQKCVFVSLIGATNAGKSTLLNKLVGSKVSIVSRKVQTTRQQIRGVAITGDAQIVFIDTPGFFKPRRRLDRAMISAAWGSMRDADMVGWLVDAHAYGHHPIDVPKELVEVRKPKFLILNKVDMLERSTLLEMVKTLNDQTQFDHTFMISALKGHGCDDILQWLAEKAPNGPWHYPEDQVSDITDMELAAEITREVVYDRLHEELPYESTCETTIWQRKPDGSIRLEQTITVARDSQKKIVLGKKGETIKGISTSARHQMAKIFECPVHLFLFVKVRENWSDDPEMFRRMRLDLKA